MIRNHLIVILLALNPTPYTLGQSNAESMIAGEISQGCLQPYDIQVLKSLKHHTRVTVIIAMTKK